METLLFLTRLSNNSEFTNMIIFIVQQSRNRNSNGIYSSRELAENAIKDFCDQSKKSCIHSEKDDFFIKEMTLDKEIKSILL